MLGQHVGREQEEAGKEGTALQDRRMDHCLDTERAIDSIQTGIILLFDLAAAPSVEINNARCPSTTHNRPSDLLVAVVDFLVLCIRWYEAEIAWSEILSLLAAVADDRAVAFYRVDDCVLGAVVVHRGGAVWFCDH